MKIHKYLNIPTHPLFEAFSLLARQLFEALTKNSTTETKKRKNQFKKNKMINIPRYFIENAVKNHQYFEKTPQFDNSSEADTFLLQLQAMQKSVLDTLGFEYKLLVASV